MNKIFIIGRITKDLELKTTANNNKYVSLDVAVDNGKDKDGNKRPSDFINCIAWQKAAETLCTYVKKGHRIAIEGSLKVEKYQNEKGENRYKTYVLVKEFEFIESKPKDNFEPSTPDCLTIEDIDNISLPNDPFNNIDVPF